MNRTNRTTPLGIIPPANPHETHELTITLKGDDGASTWSGTLSLDTRRKAPPKLLIFELPTALVKPTGRMRQHTSEQSEFTVKLAGTASPAMIRDLSHTPLANWMATMFQTFARCPAAVAVLCNQGRISVALHEGE